LVKTPGRKKAAALKKHLQHAYHSSLEDKSGSTSSMDTFHSVPMGSPGDHIQQIETFSQTSEVMPIENNNQLEVPTAPVEIFPQIDEVLLPIEVPTAPSSQLLYDRDRVLTDIQEEDVEMSVKLIDNKPIPPSFPTLPEPIPLRKSTKPPRDPSINAVLLGAATPGAPVGGMRTSWLMKAREANIDRLSKKSHPPGMGSEVGASSSLTFQGTKRKSDHFSLPQVDERPPKLAKTSERETRESDPFSLPRDDERPPKLAKTSKGETRESDPFSLPRDDERLPKHAKTSEGETRESDPFSLPRDDERPPKLAKTSEGETRKSDPFHFSLPQVGIRDDERPPKFAKTSESEMRESDLFSLPQVGIRDDERPPKLAKTSEGEKTSSDPFSLPQVGIRDDTRPLKLAKTLEGETKKSDLFSLPQVGIRNDERPPTKLTKSLEVEMESQSQPPVIVESAQEGVFNRLKKVVEDLGIRVGK
jgi:hypothetical protein